MPFLGERIGVGVLALLSTIPLPSCSPSNDTAGSEPRSIASVREPEGFFSEVAPLLPNGVAIDLVEGAALKLFALRLQLVSMVCDDFAAVPGILRDSVKRVVLAVLERSPEGKDLIDELVDALKPHDIDHDGVLLQRDILALGDVNLSLRWRAFLSEHGSALQRYIGFAKLLGWTL